MICALDVGTTKICALIGAFDENGALRIVGFGRVPSRGLRRGVVVNTTEAKAAIGQAIQQAEAAAGAEGDGIRLCRHFGRAHQRPWAAKA